MIGKYIAKFNLTCLLIAFVFNLFSVTIVVAEEHTLTIEFNNLLKGMVNSGANIELQKFSEQKLLSILTAANNEKIVQAYFELWINHHFDIELQWWRTQNRILRCLILSSYYCFMNEDIDDFPCFDCYIKIFAQEELNNRKEELLFVKKHRWTIAERMMMVIKDINPNVYQSRYKKFENLIKAKKELTGN
jgi:hypothetical protein